MPQLLRPDQILVEVHDGDYKRGNGALNKTKPALLFEYFRQCGYYVFNYEVNTHAKQGLNIEYSLINIQRAAATAA